MSAMPIGPSEVGVPVGSVKSPAEKDDLIAELDALVSLFYELSEEQVGTCLRPSIAGGSTKPA